MRCRSLLICGLVLFSCRSNKPVGAGTTDTAGTGHDDGEGTVLDDTGPIAGDSGEGAAVDFPVGRWSDCSGSLEIAAVGTWQWVDAESGCLAAGLASGDTLVLVLDPPTENTCGDDLPWWLPTEAEGSVRHNHTDNGSRLTLVPEIATCGTGSSNHNEKHLYSQIDRRRWLLENEDGLQSHFDACFSPEGVFFEGGYRSIDGSCDFLSCGGAISEWRESNGNIHIWTACAGDCPCAGVVVATDHSDTEMSGNYAGANCALVMEGTFTGTRLSTPDGDAP